MKILDRYLIKNFLLPLIYCLVIFALLYVIADIIGHLDEILKNKVPLNMIYQYYGSFLPLIFVQTTPVASLLAVVYMLSIMNKNNELTACKACGISVARLLLPVFLIGFILSLLIFLINENVVPKSIITNEKIKADYFESMAGQKKEAFRPIQNLTFYGEKNQIIYAKEFSPKQNKLSEIIILEQGDNNHIRRKILAAYAVWTGNEWVFYNCIIYRFGAAGEPVGNPLVFEKKIIDFPQTPKQILRYEFQTGYASYRELKSQIKRLSGQDIRTINRLKTDLYFKTALPFVCLIIMLLGIPFALTTRRGGAMAGIGISVGVGLLYYGSIYFSLALGKGGVFHPLLAAHLSNIIFTIVAIHLLRRAPM